MTRQSGPYAALALAVGMPCGFAFGALVPAIAAALIATNLALYAAFRIWGTEAPDA